MFWSWCKERWELLTGFVVGILAVIVALKSGSSKDILEEKNKSQKKINDAKDAARLKLEKSYDKNIQDFLEKDVEIKEEFQDKLSNLNKEKKERVNELINSNSPEKDIANALKEILK